MARLEATRHILAVRDLRTATDFYLNVLGQENEHGDDLVGS